MNAYDTTAGRLLSDVNDFLTSLETVLHTASVDERVAIEDACEVVYPGVEGGCYPEIVNMVAELRDRMYQHLES